MKMLKLLLKYLSNFLKTLVIPLINCKVSLSLTGPKNCIITSKATRDAVAVQRHNPTVAEINNRCNI